MSEVIRERLQAAGASFKANDCISDFVTDGDIDLLQGEVEERVRDLLDALVIDWRNDHNSAETAKRVAKLYLREVFAGRYHPAPASTDFPNVKQLDELYVVGPMAVRSACSHHLCPIEGNLWVGVVPGDRVIGLSKFSRIARWIMARPQIQEEAVVQLADELERLMKPVGLAVVVSATHTCMTWRGVQEKGTVMTTSVMRGAMRENIAARAEFLALVNGPRFACS